MTFVFKKKLVYFRRSYLSKFSEFKSIIVPVFITIKCELPLIQKFHFQEYIQIIMSYHLVTIYVRCFCKWFVMLNIHHNPMRSVLFLGHTLKNQATEGLGGQPKLIIEQVVERDSIPGKLRPKLKYLAIYYAPYKEYNHRGK